MDILGSLYIPNDNRQRSVEAELISGILMRYYIFCIY